jgi:hypothetical protein
MSITFRALSLLLLATIPGIPARAQRYAVAMSQTEERPAGLVALPEIFGDYPCEPIRPQPVQLFATPSKQRPAIAVIERKNVPKPTDGPDCDETEAIVRRLDNGGIGPLPTDESGYEYTKAVVYQQSGNWFRIAIPGGSGWIERPNSEGFMSYPEDLASEEFLTYLRPNWDGNIWTTSGSGNPVTAPAAWRVLAKDDIPVRVVSTQVVRGEKWVRVRFEREVCGRSFENVPQLEGWLPAYRDARTTSVWFWSRGC